MIIGVRSVHNGRYGVVDDSTNSIIIPIIHKKIVFQKGGIVAQTDNNLWTAYLPTGKPLLNGVNILFLNSNLLLVSTLNNACFIYNYTSGTYLCNIPFESILVFIGNNQQAIIYNSTANIYSLLNTPDYIRYGAHLENLVCAKLNGKWGIINIQTGVIHANFVYKSITQCTNNHIVAKDFNDNDIVL